MNREKWGDVVDDDRENYWTNNQYDDDEMKMI